MKIILLLVIFSIIFTSLGYQAFAQSDDKVAVLETNLGTIVIEFFPEDAPKHVENFISLTESGFYDGTLFHRIIPNFMIQGGDPNTISGDPNTWGIGGPSGNVDAEFNSIKHNRGIVSMARAADPNSAGSQFFIVHQNSNFLDGQYTVFGRIITQESFETLDKIASVETTDRDAPTDIEKVRIKKISIMNLSEISNVLELSEPERADSEPTPSAGNQKYESTQHEISFSIPEGWLLQEPDKTQENSPDVVAVGPKMGEINPVISLTVQDTNQRTFDDLIAEKQKTIKPVIESGQLNIISQGRITIDGNEAYSIDAIGIFSAGDESFNVKFKEIMVYGNEKFYTLAYSNGVNEFDSQLARFDETIESFEILSDESTNLEASQEEGGGCLIATATFGSELAPQVQQLRELRDNTILSTQSGVSFMSGFNQFYYLFSPTIADYERENPVFKEIVKISITPMLSTLSILNYADINSEHEMISYGVGIILMNVGMYFVAPAIIIHKIRK
ncbi:MAG: peptidylprolyl isomerase [Nitrosopumilus sp.]|nr:peptidylprolyl isomerase [Nitrosopumilus sp.]